MSPKSPKYSKGNTPNFSWNITEVWKNWLQTYKTGNISETVEDRAKVTINGLHKVVHAFDCMILNDIWASVKVADSLNAAKMTKCSLVMIPAPCRVAGWIIYIKLVYSRARALTYSLT